MPGNRGENGNVIEAWGVFLKTAGSIIRVPGRVVAALDVVPLYCVSNGRLLNHHPDPVTGSNLTELIEKVQVKHADLGIAFDGDADRLGAVDDRGRVIWGDQLMALFWREILPKHTGAVAIIEVKCSQGLVDEVVRLGGKPHFYRTGHSLIKARMRELRAVFTGEMSGHMFFADLLRF